MLLGANDLKDLADGIVDLVVIIVYDVIVITEVGGFLAGLRQTLLNGLLVLCTATAQTSFLRGGVGRKKQNEKLYRAPKR